MAASVLSLPESRLEKLAIPLRDLRRAESDAVAVETQVLDSLAHSPYAALRSITCRFREGVLTLRGHVASYHLKQLAQVAVMRLGLHGVVLNNRIEVDR